MKSTARSGHWCKYSLDKRWSPEQVAHELAVMNANPIAVETIYQALYIPSRFIDSGWMNDAEEI